MEMRRYQYCYAVVRPDLEDLCTGVRDTTAQSTNPNWIEIPRYNEEYLMKYYNRENRKWYLDAEKTQEWTPS